MDGMVGPGFAEVFQDEVLVAGLPVMIRSAGTGHQLLPGHHESADHGGGLRPALGHEGAVPVHRSDAGADGHKPDPQSNLPGNLLCAGQASHHQQDLDDAMAGIERDNLRLKVALSKHYARPWERLAFVFQCVK